MLSGVIILLFSVREVQQEEPSVPLTQHSDHSSRTSQQLLNCPPCPQAGTSVTRQRSGPVRSTHSSPAWRTMTTSSTRWAPAARRSRTVNTRHFQSCPGRDRPSELHVEYSFLIQNFIRNIDTRSNKQFSLSSPGKILHVNVKNIVTNSGLKSH